MKGRILGTQNAVRAANKETADDKATDQKSQEMSVVDMSMEIGSIWLPLSKYIRKQIEDAGDHDVKFSQSEARCVVDQVEDLEEKSTLNERAVACFENAKEKGFWDRHRPIVEEALCCLLACVESEEKQGAVIEYGRLPKEALGYAIDQGWIRPLPPSEDGITYVEAMRVGYTIARFLGEGYAWKKWFRRSPEELIALLHSECSELLEAFREGNPRSEKIGDKGFSQAEEEIADLLIRIFDFAGGYGFDLDGAIEAKMAYNAERSHMHGKKF